MELGSQMLAATRYRQWIKTFPTHPWNHTLFSRWLMATGQFLVCAFKKFFTDAIGINTILYNIYFIKLTGCFYTSIPFSSIPT